MGFIDPCTGNLGRFWKDAEGTFWFASENVSGVRGYRVEKIGKTALDFDVAAIKSGWEWDRKTGWKTIISVEARSGNLGYFRTDYLFGRTIHIRCPLEPKTQPVRGGEME